LEARDKPLIAGMAGLAASYPRFGYRRINVFTERLGHVMDVDKAATCGPRPDCRCPGSGLENAWLHPARARNCRWEQTNCGPYDFVYDACANGQQIKCLTVAGEYARERLAIYVARSFRSGLGDRGAVSPNQRT